MKKSIITMMCLLNGVIAMAQTTTEMKTLFKAPSNLGWYVASDFAYSQLDGKDAYLGGFSGGMVINHKISVGIGGYWLANSDDFLYPIKVDGYTLGLNGGYGGLKLEYRLKPSSLLHISFPMLIGGGGFEYGDLDGHDGFDNEDRYDYLDDGFFVVEPGVALGINIVKLMRLDVGVTYRYAPGIDFPTFNNFNGVTGNFSLKFGKF
jgi:hypothetical protein